MMDVIGQKCQGRGRLAIMNFRRVVYYFLTSLLFTSYGVLFVVFHGVLAPKSEVYG
jgi:hypothetical protein